MTEIRAVGLDGSVAFDGTVVTITKTRRPVERIDVTAVQAIYLRRPRFFRGYLLVKLWGRDVAPPTDIGLTDASGYITETRWRPTNATVGLRDFADAASDPGGVTFSRSQTSAFVAFHSVLAASLKWPQW